MTTFKVVLGLLLGVATAQGQSKSAAFCDTIKALTEDPTVAAAHWGVSVTTLEGRVLCGLNQAQLFRPASNNKLFTIAAALALLPTDMRFSTRVLAVGGLSDGVLSGNLELFGGGDANFGSRDVPYLPPSLQPKPPKPEPATIADIEELADEVVAKGVKSITGDVVGSDVQFAWQPYPLGWDIGDLSSSDGAPVSALTIHDSALQIQVAPNVDGRGQATLTVAPNVPYYTLEDSVSTDGLGQSCGAWLKYQRPPGSRSILVFGDIAPGAKPCSHDTAIQDPAEYAALALKAALERRGVQIAGSAVAKHLDPHQLGGVFTDRHDPDLFLQRLFQHDPHPIACNVQGVAGPAEPQRTTLATHLSPTLAEDVMLTAKVSQNLHAEVMLRNLGAAYTCGGTERDSLHVVYEYLLFAGIKPADLVLYDGSGLSGHDLVAPEAFTQLLVFAAKQKWFDTFKAALPIGGVDGTLASRFVPPNSKLQGKVFAKTGTLGESRDLAGYVTAASGKTIVFSIMADNHRPDTSADRVAMDKIVEAIAAEN